MTMPDEVFGFDYGDGKPIRFVYGGTRIVGDTSYTRTDIVTALKAEIEQRKIEAEHSEIAVRRLYGVIEEMEKQNERLIRMLAEERAVITCYGVKISDFEKINIEITRIRQEIEA